MKISIIAFLIAMFASIPFGIAHDLLPDYNNALEILYFDKKQGGKINENSYVQLKKILSHPIKIDSLPEKNIPIFGLLVIYQLQKDSILVWRNSKDDLYVEVQKETITQEESDEIFSTKSFFKCLNNNNSGYAIENVSIKIIKLGEKKLNPLPKSDQIKKGTFSIFQVNGDVVKGLILDNKYSDFRTLFKNSVQDYNPSKWQVMGSVIIETSENKSIHISIYRTGDNIGAFSVERTKLHRQYYRGSTDRKFEEFFKILRTNGGN